MAMNLVRTGSAAMVGVASGVLTPPTVPTFTIGTQVVQWGTVAEAGALVLGSVMQFVAPFTMPNLNDGLVDGGAALLVRRATVWALGQTVPTAARAWVPLQVSPAAQWGSVGAPAGVRAQVGGISGVEKAKLS